MPHPRADPVWQMPLRGEGELELIEPLASKHFIAENWETERSAGVDS